MGNGNGAGYIYFMEHAGLTKIGHSYYPYGTRCAMSGRLRLYAHAPTCTCSGSSSPACSP
jgi:hypothetical protein